MAIGSSFAAVNTMYAAVARRAREIGTLRVLGFSRGSILWCFFLESVLLGARWSAGLSAGAAAQWITGIGTAKLSETAFGFHVSPEIMLGGSGSYLLLGFFPPINKQLQLRFTSSILG